MKRTLGYGIAAGATALALGTISAAPALAAGTTFTLDNNITTPLPGGWSSSFYLDAGDQEIAPGESTTQTTDLITQTSFYVMQGTNTFPWMWVAESHNGQSSAGCTAAYDSEFPSGFPIACGVDDNDPSGLTLQLTGVPQNPQWAAVDTTSTSTSFDGESGNSTSRSDAARKRVVLVPLHMISKGNHKVREKIILRRVHGHKAVGKGHKVLIAGKPDVARVHLTKAIAKQIRRNGSVELRVTVKHADGTRGPGTRRAHLDIFKA